MKFSFTLLSATTAAILSVPNVAALNYRGYSSTVSCSGSAFGCSDGGGVCCSLPTGFGFSVQFDNLESGTQGQGYTGGGCSNFLFDLFGPGTKCWNGGGTRATHMNWFHSPQGRRGVHEARAIENTANKECASPTFFTYTSKNGTERTIKVPAEDGAAQAIADLYHANDLESLDGYADF